MADFLCVSHLIGQTPEDMSNQAPNIQRAAIFWRGGWGRRAEAILTFGEPKEHDELE